MEKEKKNPEPYLFFSWYSGFTRLRESKANIAGEGLSDCGSDSSKEEEEQKDEEILQGDFMEESETTENQHAVSKSVTSITSVTPQPFSPTSFPQNDVLASQHTEVFHGPGFLHSSDSENYNDSFQYINMMK